MEVDTWHNITGLQVQTIKQRACAFCFLFPKKIINIVMIFSVIYTVVYYALFMIMIRWDDWPKIEFFERIIKYFHLLLV